MSIWASLDAPNDDEHEDGCAFWVDVSDDPCFQILHPSGKPCDCGQPNAPLVYHGSHVLPELDDERGGGVDLAIILPHVRYWRENPDATTAEEPEIDTHPIEPFLRLGVYGISGETVILTRPQVQALIRELNWFLDKSRPLRLAS